MPKTNNEKKIQDTKFLQNAKNKPSFTTTGVFLFYFPLVGPLLHYAKLLATFKLLSDFLRLNNNQRVKTYCPPVI